VLRSNIDQGFRSRKNDDVEHGVLRLRTRQGNQHRQEHGKPDGMKNAGVKQEQRDIASFLFHGQKSEKFEVARGTLGLI
jgi:hypothetical protein